MAIISASRSANRSSTRQIVSDARGRFYNLHYEFCNAMLWLGRLLGDIPRDLLQMVTIQFPDPWFKKKHAKRRMVTRELVETVISNLGVGGEIFVQTDIKFLAEEMFELFRAEKRIIGN